MRHSLIVSPINVNGILLAGGRCRNPKASIKRHFFTKLFKRILHPHNKFNWTLWVSDQKKKKNPEYIVKFGFV